MLANLKSNLKVIAAGAVAFAALTTAIATSAFAGTDPVLLHEHGAITIDAPVSKVWAVAGNFKDLTWVPVVKTSTATRGNHQGSHRTLDFGGAQMTETLVRYSAANHRYTYRIDDSEANHKLVPLSDAVLTIRVTAKGPDTSVVTWSANFRRLDHSETPAPGADDAAARKQILGTFDMGLKGLKSKVAAD